MQLTAVGCHYREVGARWMWVPFEGGLWGRVELWTVSPQKAVWSQSVEVVFQLVHRVWFDVVETDSEVAH